MPELMLFDLDGTVLDGAGLPEAMRRTCETVTGDLPGVSAAALVEANDAAWARMWPEVEDDYMLGGRRGDAIGRDVWRAALDACGVRDDALLDRAIAAWDREERASLRLFTDALPVLDALRRDGTRVGMVTNGAATVQRDKLEMLGILDRFDPLVISSEAGFMKPDPRIFEVALAQADVAASKTWFVGDHLWHDTLGAQEAGVRALWLDRGGIGLQPSGPQPDGVIRSLTELRGSAETT